MWWHWTDHMILIYKIMTNLVLLKSGQKKVTIEEVDSLLFCILNILHFCMFENIQKSLQLSHSFPLGEDYLIFFTTCTHLFNQFTNDCIVEIFYCCPLNTLQSRCKIYFTQVCEYMETRWIHSQEGHGGRAREPDPSRPGGTQGWQSWRRQLTRQEAKCTAQN